MGIAIAVLVTVTVVSIAVLGVLFGVGSSSAKALVRRAAMWSHSDLDTPEELARQWQSRIDDCPARPTQVILALSLFSGAAFGHGAFVGRLIVADVARTVGKPIGASFKALGTCIGTLVAVVQGWRRLGLQGTVLALVAVALFLLGAVIGQWLVLAAAALTACASRFYTSVEKWAVIILVPVMTALIYAIGFWLLRAGYPGGHRGTTADLLSGFASYFGTLPRIAGIIESLFLAWRLARGVTRSV